MIALLLAIAVATSDARALAARAIALTNEWRVDDAERLGREALRVAESDHDDDGRARALDVLGIVARLRGHRDDAVRLTGEALAIATDPETLARIENDRGRIAFELESDFGSARTWYERGLRRAPRVRDRTIVARLDNNLATLDRAENDFAAAIRLYARAAAESKRAGDRLGIVAAEHNIGLIESQQNSPAPALLHLRRALALERALHNHSAVAHTLLSIAESQRALGNALHADANVDAALHEAERSGDRAIVGTILLRVAELRIRRGALQRAEAAIDRSIEIFRDDAASMPQALTVRARLHLAQRRASESASIAVGAAEDAERLGQISVAAEAQTIAGQAYLAAGSVDDARRALHAAIAAVERERSFVVGGADVRERSFEERVVPYRILLGITSGPELLELAERLKARELLDVLRGSRADVPPPVDDAARLLPRPDDAIVEYAITDAKLIILVITHDGLHEIERAIPRPQLRAIADRLARELADRNLGFRATARELYDILIAPAEERLRGVKRICIVPDEELWRVPFQALLDGSNRYLLERSAIFYAPSIAVLEHAMRRAQPMTFDSLLAVGNAAIPETQAEVAALRSIYVGSGIDVLPHATCATVEALMPRFRIVHFATHAVFDDGNPLGSRLTFDDGELDARRMLQLRLHAALIVLSACRTAAGRPAGGEGLIGMSWALFVAGCPAMVASEWNVESTSTTQVMIRFHRSLAAGMPLADALRDAQLALLHGGKYEHPFYWAAFVAIGQGW